MQFFSPTLTCAASMCESECVWLCVCVGLRSSLHFSFAGVVAFLSRKRKSNICAAAADWFPPWAGPLDGRPLLESIWCARSLTTPTHTHTLTTGIEHSRNTFCFSRSTTHPFYCPLSIVVFPPALLLKLLQLRLQLQCQPLSQQEEAGRQAPSEISRQVK